MATLNIPLFSIVDILW